MVRTFSEKLPAGIFVIAELAAVTLCEYFFYFILACFIGEEIGFIVYKYQFAVFGFSRTVDNALNHKTFAFKCLFSLFILRKAFGRIEDYKPFFSVKCFGVAHKSCQRRGKEPFQFSHVQLFAVAGKQEFVFGKSLYFRFYAEFIDIAEIKELHKRMHRRSA